MSPEVNVDGPVRSSAGPVAASPLRRWMLRALAAMLLLLIAAEFILRFGFGLGDPPLYLSDDQLGYRMRPGLSRPFGNRVYINERSMRCADVPDRKTDPRELRVLVIGDSIVYGGSALDDSQLATSLLEGVLAKATGRPTRVLNISCGSWGPGNQLAYLKRYGTFDADAAILVFNSLDFGATVHVGLSWAQPASKPWLAIEEAAQRWLVRQGLGPNPSAGVDEYHPTPADAARSLDDLEAMVTLLRGAGVKVAAVQHPKVSELSGGWLEGHARILARLTSLGVPVVQSEDAFKASLAKGEVPYRDDIHPSAPGQVILADVFRQAWDALSR